MNRVGLTKLFLRKLKKLNNKRLVSQINENINCLNQLSDYKDTVNYLQKLNSKPMVGAYRGYKIYKYYASNDSGARIIYSYGEDMNNDYLLCLLNIEIEHKKQAKTAKRKISDEMVDYSNSLSYYVKDNHTLDDYSLLGCKVILDYEQYASTKINTPVLITGNAGTGKTLVSMRIMLDNEVDKREFITYITLSSELKNNIECDFLLQLGTKPTHSDFYDFKSFASKDIVCKIATYQDFCLFIQEYKEKMDKTISVKYSPIFDSYVKYKKLDNLYLYHTINKDIKGRMLENWDRDINDKMVGFEDLVKIMQKENDYFDQDELLYIYKIAEEYQVYLESHGLLDDNDLAICASNKEVNCIVLDEAQDFTELQLFILSKISKGNIYFVGDVNQILTPSLFKASRLLKLIPELKIPKTFTNNYRNDYNIVSLISTMTKLRRNYINTQKMIDERDEVPVKKPTRANSVLRLESNNIRDNIISFLKKPNSCCIVANEKIKRELNIDSVLTVKEAKGQEFNNVFLYNIMSGYSDKWQEILSLKAKTKKNSSYRYYFNLLYVGITRAIDRVVLYESEKNLLDEFNIPMVNEIEFTNYLSLINDDFDEYYETFLICEENKDYDKCREILLNIKDKFDYDIKTEYGRIESKIMFDEGKYNDSNWVNNLRVKLEEAEEYDLLKILNDKTNFSVPKPEVLEELEFIYSKNIKGYNVRKDSYLKPVDTFSLKFINNKIIGDIIYGYIYKLKAPIVKDFQLLSSSLNIKINDLKNKSIKEIIRLVSKDKLNDYFYTELEIWPSLIIDNQGVQKKLDEIDKIQKAIIKNDVVYSVIYEGKRFIYEENVKMIVKFNTLKSQLKIYSK